MKNKQWKKFRCNLRQLLLQAGNFRPLLENKMYMVKKVGDELMDQFAVNVSTIFTEVPFIERFQKAKEFSFSRVECQFPYSEPAERIREELEKYRLSLVLINLPAGNWEKGERGLAIFPDRIGQFKQSVDEGIRYATNLNVSLIHCMAGILPPELDRQRAKEVYIDNLQYAAEKLAQHGLTLLIEPINPYDMPGYFLTDIREAAEIIEEVGMPNVKLQYDFYHMQRMQGNLIATFQAYFSLIGHVQIADVPGRHEPGTGEIHYERIFQFLQSCGYTGAVGLEYIPKTTSEASFAWCSAHVLERENK